MPALLQLLQDAGDILIPPLCSACGQNRDDAKDLLCDRCRQDLQALGELVCARCGALTIRKRSAGRCPKCPRGDIYFDKARGAFQYRDTLREAIQRFKYNGRLELAEPFARAMFVELFAWENSKLQELEIAALLPVPMHYLRRAFRGFNHSEILSRELSSLTGVPTQARWLERIRHTRRQALLPYEQRISNIFGAIRVNNPETIAGKKVALIDDVLTSGVTVNECARVLKQSGAEEVWVFTLARA